MVVALVARGADAPPGAPVPGASPAGSPASGDPANGVPDSEPSSGPTEVPDPGSLEPVTVEEVTVAPAVGLDDTADFGTGLTLRITSIEAVAGEARGPGQVSGPALRLRVEARNSGAGAVSLEGMVVALAHGAGDTPAMSLLEPGARPFEGEVPPGGEAVAAYVFAVPPESRDRVTITASYTGSAPTVVFEGAAGRVS